MIDAAFLVTLFVIVDPIGLAPLFVALTQGLTTRHRYGIAVRSCGISLILLALFGSSARRCWGFVGISMPAFRIVDGAVLS